MTWNYRVIEFSHDDDGNPYETTCYSIHEVYYDKNGKPRCYGSTSAGINWDADEDKETPCRILDRMRKALSEPTLNSRIFVS